MTSLTATYLACSICKQPIRLETSKTDEYGKAVHEECYVLKISSKPPQTTADNTEGAG